MQPSKYRHAAPCALVGGRINIIARTKKAYRTARGLLAGKARIARASVAPRCTAALGFIYQSSAVARTRLRSARQRVAHELVLRALHTGDVPSDLDRRGAACRIVMWSFVALAGLVWLALGWKHAALPLLGALSFGSAATVYWDAAEELERREHPHWER